MTRAFTAGHSKIDVSAILHNQQYKGDTNYLSDRGKTASFGIRHIFVNDVDGEGVIPITLALEQIGENMMDDMIMNETEVQGVKYAVPDFEKC